MTIDELLQPILKTAVPLRIDDSPQTIPGWDSLAQINIIVAIEDILGTELSTTDVLSLTSVNDVIKVCRSHGIQLESNESM